MSDSTAKIDSTQSAQTDSQVQDVAQTERERLLDVAQRLPFPGLTEIRRLLLAVCFDPDTACLTISRRCELVGVSRRSYYDAIHNPEYKAASKELARLAWEAIQPELQAKYIKLAQGEGKDANRAMERILEQGESLREKAGPMLVNSLTMTSEQLTEKRRRNQAEGLALLGIVIPDYLPSPSNGNGKKKPGRDHVREAIKTDAAATPPPPTPGDDDAF